jgi:hypothetical protein
VLDVANRLLPHIADGVPPATSVRPGAGALRFAARAGLVSEVERALAQPGSVAVIVADDEAAPTAAALRAAGVAVVFDNVGGPGGAGHARHPDAADADPADGAEEVARVSVVGAGTAKGLEFDSVLVVEPAAIVAAEATHVVGLRRLYVVLTRAVSHLAVLHDEPLPAELAA